MSKPFKRRRERFVCLPNPRLESQAWQDLSPKAVCILIELYRRFNGSNNGEIGLSCREAACVAHCGKGNANRFFQELIEHGFIKLNNKGHYQNRHASTWILTTEPYEGKAPTNEWKYWVTKKPQYL